MSKAKKSTDKQQESLAVATSQKNNFDDPPKNIEMEMPWIVRKVTPQEDYTLLLQFDDGKQGVFNMWPIIQQEDGGDDTFIHLENLNKFMKAYVFAGTVFWPGDVSIAPETLYDECMTMQEYKEWCAEDEEDAEHEEE